MPTPTRRQFVKGFAGLSATPLLPAPAAADQMVFGFRPVAPMVFRQADGTLTGLEYEIVKAALASADHRISPYIGPNARLAEAIENGAVDGMAPATELGPDVVLSNAYLVYDNIVLSRAADGLAVERMADLAAYRIMGFQRARQILGPDYAAAVARSPEYREEATQSRQILSLMHGRVDLIVGERRILRHFLREAAGAEGRGAFAVTEHSLFPPLPVRAAFRDPVWAERFNAGLERMRANGQLDAILARYAEQT